MIRISDIVKEIIDQNNFLEFGLRNKLFNLTRLAEFLKPLIEVRTKKEVSQTAVLMNLSRLQQKYNKITPQLANFKIENVTVRGGLHIMSFYKNAEIHNRINQLYTTVQKQNGYIAFTEGVGEITLIIEEEFLEKAQEMLTDKPKGEFQESAALIVKFHPRYVEHPGMLYFLMQKITLQNINILEISSTFTELIFYIESQKTKLAFETMQSFFTENNF